MSSPWTVSQLTERVKSTLESSFPKISVQGEVTDLSRPSSGHLYFTLKDSRAQIRGIIWRSTAARLPFKIANGQELICWGDVEVYAARGSYQLVIRKAVPQGMGSLQLAFEQLRQRLAAEGLFEPGRKQPIPAFPRRVGFVTSPGGAAIRDFLEVAARRSAAVQIVLIPAQVQGDGGAESICRGIAAAHQIRPQLDALVVGRGGGSLEDLWCFNEEPVVRAIAAARLPTVSAVGHEIDVTLADLVADRRALTPSEAAELLVPSAEELTQSLRTLQQRLLRPVQHRLQNLRDRLQAVESRTVFSRPHDGVKQLRRRLDELDLRAGRAVRYDCDRARQRLGTATASLEALSPLAVLHRGYSVTTDATTGKPLRDADQVNAGDQITTRLEAGTIRSRVE
ncbi:exodeoxyribonuclease VII large subunit [Roseimaritima ulvae]|uniref:Exodeoxyribonuclease 7 large subunit n=1 Tax=Roseimaritima ulvae TaxID=980254 RepID=A0A5B9QR39_9BACT|nr:exodeoxyribonuclease VII large subunit [Roseimaritima ulvae]QEG40379.1 Exodeoxyribonuclease 7 large subunit [Roseimaritima ulvae]